MRLSLRRASAPLIAASLLLAACGGDDDDTDTGPSDTTVAAEGDTDETSAPDGTIGDSAAEGETGGTLYRTLLAMDQSLDPAVFYGGPADGIEMAIYESLVRYPDGTAATPGVRDYAPWLATEWTVSDDALVYTFTIREGVKFHDGTDLDAEAVRYSFQRSIDVADAPSFMLAAVASMEVPDPYTLVITLSQAEDGFLDYFASPYGPKVVSPAAIEANKGDDNGVTYLQTNAVGTGPYTLVELGEDVGYRLAAFPDYWGEKPYYEAIEYALIPETTSQLLQFEQGDLDMLTFGVTIQDLNRLAQVDGIGVDFRPKSSKGYLMVNPNKGVTANEDFRHALAASIDRTALVTGVYGASAAVSSDFYQPGALPAGVAPDPDRYDPTVMPALLEAKPEYKQTITLAHGNSAIITQLAETMQIQLQAVGLSVELLTLTGTEAFGYVGKPLDAPDLFLSDGVVDTAAPAAFALVYLKQEAPVNWLGIDIPAADLAIEQALAEPDAAKRDELYALAAEEYLGSGQIITLFDPQGFVLYHEDKVNRDAYKYDLINGYDLQLQSIRP